jgi:hypothetical protein
MQTTCNGFELLQHPTNRSAGIQPSKWPATLYRLSRHRSFTGRDRQRAGSCSCLDRDWEAFSPVPTDGPTGSETTLFFGVSVCCPFHPFNPYHNRYGLHGATNGERHTGLSQTAARAGHNNCKNEWNGMNGQQTD